MYRWRIRFLSALLFLILLCSAAQATNLQITVQDGVDNSSVPHATIFLNGINLGKTNNNGQFVISHQGLDDLNLRVVRAGYEDWSGTAIRNATALLVNLSRKSFILKVNLYDSDTLKPVSGASINLSGENWTQTKQSDTYGQAVFGVNAVTLYTIDITSPLYQPRSGTVDVGGIDKEVQYWLLPTNRFAFVVKEPNGTAAVQDAEVRIDSVLIGKTDSRGILTTQVSRDKTYFIEVKKEGYQTYTETRTISDTDALDAVVLVKAPVGAIFYVVDTANAALADADIYLNGTLQGTTNQYGRLSIPGIVIGSYQIEIRKVGYLSIKKLIEVSLQAADFTIELPFGEADLTIFVQDKDQKVLPNATVLLNGNTTGYTDDHGQLVTAVKYTLVNNITASKEGYQTVSVKKQVMPGNTTSSVTMILEKNPDWGLVMMVLIGAVGVLVVFAAIRMSKRRKRRHVIRRNDI